MTRKTDYLVVGANPGKTKLARARENQAKGLPVAIITGDEFLRLLA